MILTEKKKNKTNKKKQNKTKKKHQGYNTEQIGLIAQSNAFVRDGHFWWGQWYFFWGGIFSMNPDLWTGGRVVVLLVGLSKYWGCWNRGGTLGGGGTFAGTLICGGGNLRWGWHIWRGPG